MWFIDGHQYWEREADFEMLYRQILDRGTFSQVALRWVAPYSTFWTGECVFDILEWCKELLPSGTLMVTSQLLLTYYQNIIRSNSGGAKHIWPIALSWLVIFLSFTFLAKVPDGIFVSKTADIRVVEEGTKFDAFVLYSDSLNRRVCVLRTHSGTEFDPVILFAASCRCREVDYTLMDLKHTFSHYYWVCPRLLR